MEGYFFHSLILDVTFFLTTLPASASLTLFFFGLASLSKLRGELLLRTWHTMLWHCLNFFSHLFIQRKRLFQFLPKKTSHLLTIPLISSSFKLVLLAIWLLKTFTRCTSGESQLSNTLQESIALHLKASTHTTLTESILFLWNSIRQKKSNTSVSCVKWQTNSHRVVRFHGESDSHQPTHWEPSATRACVWKLKTRQIQSQEKRSEMKLSSIKSQVILFFSSRFWVCQFYHSKVYKPTPSNSTNCLAQAFTVDLCAQDGQFIQWTKPLLRKSYVNTVSTQCL